MVTLHPPVYGSGKVSTFCRRGRGGYCSAVLAVLSTAFNLTKRNKNTFGRIVSVVYFCPGGCPFTDFTHFRGVCLPKELQTDSTSGMLAIHLRSTRHVTSLVNIKLTLADNFLTEESQVNSHKVIDFVQIRHSFS